MGKDCVTYEDIMRSSLTRIDRHNVPWVGASSKFRPALLVALALFAALLATVGPPPPPPQPRRASRSR